MLAALIAGGFGGYLNRGGTSSVSTARTTPVSAPALSGLFFSLGWPPMASPATTPRPKADLLSGYDRAPVRIVYT